MYKILKNFLPPNVFLQVNSFLKSEDTPWFYKNSQVFGDEDDSEEFFSHNFYEGDIPYSEGYNTIIKPFYEYLEINTLMNARANLLINKGEHKFCPWHIDRGSENTTAIYYVNKCNGFTELKDDAGEIIKVESEENKILIFDGYHEHRAISQTDTKERIVINFNYF